MGIPKSLEDEIEKLKKIMQYWIAHNNEHIKENERWLKNINDIGLANIADEVRAVINNLKEANNHANLGLKKLEDIKAKDIKQELIQSEPNVKPENYKIQKEYNDIHFIQIGLIHTPYTNNAPYQPVDSDEGNFTIILDPKYTDGLYRLARFKYIYVLYYIHKIDRKPEMRVSPPWALGNEVGIFASRSPVRPNPLGLSIVRLKKIDGNVLYTSGLDVFDGTPLLDIKPYIKDLDSKSDANYGWIESQKDWEHLILHLKGIPHDY